MSKEDTPMALYFVFGIFFIAMLGTWWYFIPKENETLIEVGDKFGPYRYKGRISAFGTDTIVVEYNGTEYYYHPQDYVSLDSEQVYHIRFPGEGTGIIIRKEERSQTE